MFLLDAHCSLTWFYLSCFSLSTQLEDEALKHIQSYCHELVSLNLQSCSVSSVPFCEHPHAPALSLGTPLQGKPLRAPLGSTQAGGMMAMVLFLIPCPYVMYQFTTGWKNNSLNKRANAEPLTSPQITYIRVLL